MACDGENKHAVAFAQVSEFSEPYATEFGEYTHAYWYLESCNPQSVLRKGIGALIIRTDDSGAGQYDYHIGIDRLTDEFCAFEIKNDPCDSGELTAGGYPLLLPKHLAVGATLDIAIPYRENIAARIGLVVGLMNSEIAQSVCT